MSAYLGSTPVNVLDVLFRNKKAVALYRGSAQVWSDWSPLDLFAGGKQGAWYDPSDKLTLFQDVAGTVPVTKDGDPVGLMLDKSGNGNPATQTTAARRPIYRKDGSLHWLEFDGVDDYMSIDPTVINSGDLSIYLTLSKPANIDGVYVNYLGNYPYDSGVNMFNGLPNNGGEMRFVASTKGGVTGTNSVASMPTLPNIYSARLDLSNRLLTSSINKDEAQSAQLIAGEHKKSSNLTLMARGAARQFAGGKVHGLIITNRVVEDYKAVEYLANKAGVTL